jgi:hypothetical protein
MQRCASVRKKGSLEQCPVAPVFGHTLCGRHARCKQPVLWIDVHRHRHRHLIRAQALIRGYLVRARLGLAGPGVLRRSGLSNDEDLVTTAETTRIDPFEYFAFTENGKIWAFEFPTLFTWALRSDVPINPYTKVPLSSDTRARLFRIWCFQIRHRKAHVSLTFLETCRLLARIFQDNGFADIGTRSFLDLLKGTWVRFFRVLQQELLTMYPESDLVRRRGIILCRRMEHFIHAGTHQVFCEISATNLLRLLTVPRDPYLLCFSILSCFYRG